MYSDTNVIPIPQLSEVDKQYITLEKQQELIREQSKLIAEKQNDLQTINT